ncbi:MAG TPA: nitrate reductase associated protein [Oxalicibacterium sp.]|uniref:nitrate reductase associated protein n=1 Tax=Oxalicibacterium sp. TaxID=2766525 RepID=UPI002B591254|nr:nitrate reductase associated protein [Oxalicibacterium sp.]HWU99240.1 nitrate reductase associated protein [Oxalicibacterium sp.]
MMALFDFEQDGRYPLRRIPMIMRFNLDACGMRISLTGWITLSRDEREELVMLPCASEPERAAFRARLAQMLDPHADNPDAVIEHVDIDPCPAWKSMQAIPQSVIDTLNDLSLPGMTLSQWTALNDLQRFALIKLTRSGHKNANLQPALKEFGLA